MEVLFNVLPKDVTYIIQEYAIDIKKYNRTKRELRERFCKGTYNFRPYLMYWRNNFDEIVLSTPNGYNEIINDVLKKKSWADPYYFEESSDEDFEICTINDCKKNAYDQSFCYEHYQIHGKIAVVYDDHIEYIERD